VPFPVRESEILASVNSTSLEKLFRHFGRPALERSVAAKKFHGLGGTTYSGLLLSFSHKMPLPKNGSMDNVIKTLIDIVWPSHIWTCMREVCKFRKNKE